MEMKTKLKNIIEITAESEDTTGIPHLVLDLPM